MTERTVPRYCRDCMHWATTHGPDGCLYWNCACPIGQDILMSHRHQKKNSEGPAA